MKFKFKALYICLVLCIWSPLWQAAGSPIRKLAGQVNCPTGCIPNKCVEDKTTGTWKCNKCANNLMLVKSSDPTQNGKCACRSGRYYVAQGGTESEVEFNHKPRCVLCEKGNYCPGGVIGGYTSNTVAQSAPQRPCSEFGAGLTSVIRAAKSKWACVELPGYGWSIANGNPTATQCMGDTYNSGYAKKGCQSCPAGFAINDSAKNSAPVLSKHDNVTDCMVPPGYYQRSPSEVAQCPQGEYQPNFNRANKCIPCPKGVTTQPAGSGGSNARVFTSVQFCNTLVPGYFSAAVLDKTEAVNSGSNFYMMSDAFSCPQKYWCPGGMPEVSFSGTGIPDAKSMVRTCSTSSGARAGTAENPLWTKEVGAASKDQCLVPPGYGLSTTGDLVKCESGSFREGWVQAVNATRPACTLCADGGSAPGSVSSTASEMLAVYPGTDPDTTVPELVIGSAGSCRMEPGFGMYQTASGFKVFACDKDNYGSNGPTFGRNVNPCRQCPANMITSTLAAADVSIKNDEGTGFISLQACITRPGFGWDGRASTQCAVGTWNAGGNRDECTACPWGYTTNDNPQQQRYSSDCKVRPGFGSNADGEVEECPLGTYNELLTEAGTACTACPSNTWTSNTAATNASDCDTCPPGYGKAAGSDLGVACTDCANWPSGPAYGPVERENTECITCPTQDTGFSFIYDNEIKTFNSAPIIKSAQTAQGSCLSEFAQIEPGLFYLRGADTNTVNGTIDQCAASCGTSCMYFTYDYYTEVCQTREYAALPADQIDALLAFKALSAGDVMGARAQAVSTGQYVQWDVKHADFTSIGASHDKSPADGTVTEKQACLEVCDFDEKCVGTLMMGGKFSDPATGAITSCSLIYGFTDPGAATANYEIAKRSLTHVVVNQIP